MSEIYWNFHLAPTGEFYGIRCRYLTVITEVDCSYILTLKVRGLSYLGLTMSTSLRRQDISSHDIDYIEYVRPSLAWGRILSTCVISMWRNDIKCKFMFMFPLKNVARKGLKSINAIWVLWYCYGFVAVSFTHILWEYITGIGKNHTVAPRYTETGMSAFWWNVHHWLHWKLSIWQLPVQPVMKISSKWQHPLFSVWLPQCQWSNPEEYG